MKTNTLEILECGRQTVSQDSVSTGNLFPFELELFGVRREFCVVLGSEKTTLQGLVHPARQLCDIIVGLTIEHQQSCGQPVRCTAGCMACCKYMVTVSPAETLAISDMINTLPRQSRQALLRNMTRAGRKILSSYSSTSKVQSSQFSRSPNPLVELSRWYAQINLTCPYIENKRCSHYADRPLVCREFMVASAAARCTPNTGGGRVIIDLPVRMSEVLMDVSAKLTGTNQQAMFMPLVPAWYEDLSDLRSLYFDARQVAKILIETIIEHRQRKMVPVTECCLTQSL